MRKAVIIDFQSHLAEARGILEAVNATEITRTEQIIAAVEVMQTQLKVRHSETITFIRECWAEQERSTSEMMTGMLRFLEDMHADYQRHLAELREAPGPKLVVSE